ncbi:methyltransferase domain-containing protein [Streptomyces sp. HNM0575]|uniref:methyltransferase domain-containing protein n=1 Tax=Streptomyces sp. HNM0575 TaxID=2716338 RepID=UPI00145DE504|nr:methyltransferase domain-containing protein [Streptomyces sp. HNM0575]NLU72794.1 methyltransferase domain-containing protein [Streptomyces sp. HNM0575]
MPDAARSALDDAVRAVPAEQFHGADGRAVRPCTPAEVTHRHLGLLDIRPGDAVLDIGVGSGLSAALAARLAGPEGRVTAVEIDAGLAARARALYAAHGHRVEVVVGDGLHGHTGRAPYDRILAGVTPPAVPDAWLRQLRPGGLLLCGVRVCDLPGGYAIARIRTGERNRPRQVTVHQGGYMPAAGPVADERVTRARARAGEPGPPGPPERSLTLLGAHEPGLAEAFLAALTDAAHIDPAPLHGSDWFHLKDWLMAAEPPWLLEATLERGNGIGVGHRTPDGTAHAALVTGFHLIADRGDSPALADLDGLIRRWRESGSPRTHQLRAELRQEGDRWHARIGTTA